MKLYSIGEKYEVELFSKSEDGRPLFVRVRQKYSEYVSAIKWFQLDSELYQEVYEYMRGQVNDNDKKGASK